MPAQTDMMAASRHLVNMNEFTLDGPYLLFSKRATKREHGEAGRKFAYFIKIVQYSDLRLDE